MMSSSLIRPLVTHLQDASHFDQGKVEKSMTQGCDCHSRCIAGARVSLAMSHATKLSTYPNHPIQSLKAGLLGTCA